MPATTASITQPELLLRFLGPGALIQERESMQINLHVQAEVLQLSFDDNSQPEDRACLYLFPIADGQFALQLFYLQEDDSSPMTYRACSLQYMPAFFEQFPAGALTANRPFSFSVSTEQPFTICTQTRSLLDQLRPALSHTPLMGILQLSETALHLLRRALACISQPFTPCQVPACRFLAFESEREKIALAGRILEENYDQPLTIRELSRRVAMNECYLKKGFKALMGKTIHEYTQGLRIERGRMLLQQGHSVSDVSAMLGFSSISHFSTAFKKATGLKPCELLR